jgi:hypothetical protein
MQAQEEEKSWKCAVDQSAFWEHSIRVCPTAGSNQANLCGLRLGNGGRLSQRVRVRRIGKNVRCPWSVVGCLSIGLGCKRVIFSRLNGWQGNGGYSRVPFLRKSEGRMQNAAQPAAPDGGRSQVTFVARQVFPGIAGMFPMPAEAQTDTSVVRSEPAMQHGSFGLR